MKEENKGELKFLHCIQAGNYPMALKILEKYDLDQMHMTKEEYMQYLYLIGFVFNTSNKDIQQAREFIHKQKDTVSNYLSRFNFIYLLRQMNNASKEEMKTVNFQIKKALLGKASNRIKTMEKEILQFLQQEDYSSLISYLEPLQEQQRLSLNNRYVLKVARDLDRLHNQKIIPKIKNKKNMTFYKNTYQMIDNKDYMSALENEKQYVQTLSEKRRQLHLNMPLYKILETMNTEIIQVKKEQEYNRYTLNYVLDSLSRLSLKDAITVVQKFLDLHHLEQYSNLMINLIKIGLLENDKDYKKAKSEFLKMQEDDYTPSIDLFLIDFYDSLENKNYFVAKRYCDLLTNLDPYKGDKDFGQKLFSIVEMIKPKNCSAFNINFDTNLWKFLNANTLSTHVLTHACALSITQIGKNYDYMKDYLDLQRQQLDANDGVILLDPMSNSLFLRMKYMVLNEYEDMAWFSVVIDGISRMVLKKQTKKTADLRQMRQSANQAYKERRYDTCIELYKQIITINKKINPFDFNQLGMAYDQKGQYEKAEKFLRIGTSFKTYQSKMTYSKVFHEIQSDLSMMHRDQYRNEFNPNTIKKIEEVASLVRQNAYPVEEACKKLNLSLEEYSLINLVCARDSYLDNQEKVGDQYLKKVERSKNKTEPVKKFLNQVRDNKKFYLRNHDIAKQLILKGN